MDWPRHRRLASRPVLAAGDVAAALGPRGRAALEKPGRLFFAPETAAEFLLSAYQGLLIRVRNGTPAKILDETVRITIEAILREEKTPKRKRKR